MDTSSLEVHINLRRVVGYQTHHRLRESMGFKRAEILNERVFWWSLTCTTAILFVSIGQVVIMRKFFSGENVEGSSIPLTRLVMEWLADRIHDNVRRAEEYQRHMRVRETQGSKRAELLNGRVLAWSLACTLSALLVSAGQVIILKRLFSKTVSTDCQRQRPQVVEF